MGDKYNRFINRFDRDFSDFSYLVFHDILINSSSVRRADHLCFARPTVPSPTPTKVSKDILLLYRSHLTPFSAPSKNEERLCAARVRYSD